MKPKHFGSHGYECFTREVVVQTKLSWRRASCTTVAVREKHIRKRGRISGAILSVARPAMTRTGKSRDLIGENAYHVTGSLNSAASVDDVFLYIYHHLPSFSVGRKRPGKSTSYEQKDQGSANKYSSILSLPSIYQAASGIRSVNRFTQATAV
jgi:hypothetical protein